MCTPGRPPIAIPARALSDSHGQCIELTGGVSELTHHIVIRRSRVFCSVSMVGLIGETRMRETMTRRSALVGAGVGLCTVFALSGCAAPVPQPGGLHTWRRVAPAGRLSGGRELPRGKVGLPPVELETMKWLDRLQRELAGTRTLARRRFRRIAAPRPSPGTAHRAPSLMG